MTMETLDLDNLFLIVEATPDLERAENALRQSGHAAMADALNKLMQDAGVQIDREMNGFDENEPAPGPQTAALNAAFEPVTSRRLSVLADATIKLAGHETAVAMANLAASLPMPPDANLPLQNPSKPFI